MPSTGINAASPVNWAHPLNRGLIAWWMVMPGINSGSRLADLVYPGDRGSHGTLVGVPEWNTSTPAPGHFGLLDFDGSVDHTSHPINHGIGTGPFAWSLWVFLRTKDGGSDTYAGFAGNDDFNPGLNWKINAVDEWGFYWGSNRGTGVALNIGEWYHLMVTRDEADDLKFYRNGILDATIGSVTNSMPDSTIWLGRRETSQASDTDGFEDDFRFYNRAPLQSEVIELYNEGRYGYPNLLNRIKPIRFIAPVGGVTMPIFDHHYRQMRAS